MQTKPLRAPLAASSLPLSKMIRATPSQGNKGRQVKTTTTTTTTTTNVILNLQVLQTTTTTTVTADVVKQEEDMQTLEYNKGNATPDKFHRT